MSHRFLITHKEWPLAVKKALTILDENSLYGEARIVDFQIGPPLQGRLPFRLFVDGRRALHCELSDTAPSFLHDMREWMERCLLFDQEGHLHPELLTLNARNLVLRFVLIHVGWDEVDSRAKPVSFLVVTRSDQKDPAVCCFCDTFDTIGDLYRALILCLRKYRSRFDSNEYWYDVKRLDGLNPVSTTERMLDEIRSSKIEKVALYSKMHKM